GPRLLAHRPRPPIPTLFPYTTLFRSHRNSQRDLGVCDVGAKRATRVAQIDLGFAELHLHRALGTVAPGIPFAVAGIRRKQRCREDRKSTRLNSSHVATSYVVFCLKKK